MVYRYIAILEDELTKIPADKRIKFDELFGIPKDQQDTIASTSPGNAIHLVLPSGIYPL